MLIETPTDGPMLRNQSVKAPQTIDAKIEIPVALYPPDSSRFRAMSMCARAPPSRVSCGEDAPEHPNPAY